MQFLRLRQAMCRFLGLPQQTAEARQKAANIIDDIDEGWKDRMEDPERFGPAIHALSMRWGI